MADPSDDGGGRGQGQGQGRGRGQGQGRGRGRVQEQVDAEWSETGRFVSLIPRGTAAHGYLGRLREMPIDAPRTIDYTFLRDVGSSARVRGIIPPTSAWARLFEAARERAYRELTLEFLATFTFADTRGQGLQHFLTTESITFSLLGETRRFTLPQFAVVMGLYSSEESRSQAFYDAPVSTTSDVLWTWWRGIGEGEFATPRSRSPKARVSRIHDPLHRYLHRCIAVTITGRHDSREWVTQQDLFFLHDLLTQGGANLAYKLAAYFSEYAFKRVTTHISCGGFITHLAKTWSRSFSPAVVRELTLCHEVDPVGRDTASSMRIAYVTPDRSRVFWSLDEGRTEWVEGGQGGGGGDVEGGGEGGGEGDGEGRGEGRDEAGPSSQAPLVDRSQVEPEDVPSERPYDRRSVRRRVMPPPALEDRMARVESVVAAIQVDVQWIVQAIIARDAGLPLPPRPDVAPHSP